MTPRTQMWALHADATAADVIAAAVASGSSRFPLYGAGLDEVTGAVLVKHAVPVPDDRRVGVPAGALAPPPITVSPPLRVRRPLSPLGAGGPHTAGGAPCLGGSRI